MTIGGKNLLRYWRNSLADMDKLGLSAQDMQKAGMSVAFEEIQKGKLIQEKIENFFIEAEKERQKRINRQRQFQKNTKQEDDKPLSPIQHLPVIISPYKVIKIHEHGKKIRESKLVSEVLPLWLVADLKRTGELVPSENKVYPWIERRCLTPNETTWGYPVIGDVLQSDKFYTKKADFFEQPGKFQWNKFFDLALALFHHVVGENPETRLREQHYELQPIGYLRPWGDTHGMSQSIINTYDQYLSDNESKLPALLEKFCSLNPQQHQPGQLAAQILIASKRHLAQPQKQFPLFASQRVSLHYFFDEENHPLVTIHGPPGTGKTSLILSIIASLWVERALQKKEPPILVAASTNNLAVTNILDHFQSQDRWLPDLHHYCLYLTSDYKKDEAIKNHYLYRLKIINPNQPEGVELLYLPKYQEKATEFFLTRFNQYFKKTATDLAECQNYIHQKMLEIQAKLHKAIDLAHDFYQTQQYITKHYTDSTQLDADILKQQAEKDRLHTAFNQWIQVRRDWLDYRGNLPLWLKIALFLGGGKNNLRNRIRSYASRYLDLFPELPTDMETMEAILDKKISDIDKAKDQITQAITDLEFLKIRYTQLCEQQAALQAQLSFEFTTDHLFDFADTRALPAKLDIHLRYELFQLATHYWEAAWLQNNIFINSCRHEYSSRQEYWRIQAMLTPCFVATLHSGPGFFQYRTPTQEFKTLSDFIDLLIIDEAGQVLPAVAAAMISVAKRALFVGDVKQIEPMAPLNESIDLGNAKKFAICTDAEGYQHLKSTGILCASNSLTGQVYGNLITLGQRHAPGMLLREHRRCAKEIISYCNELCYDNQLVVMTPEKPSIYPRMGYAHIKGIEKRNGGSLSNPLEAEVIVRWIADNSDNIRKNCGLNSLADCIGIITPFLAQADTIKDELFNRRLRIDKVGTVHSLQGAEKPIIIFSPVYTEKASSGQFFFDRSPNMLNVAVSRAKMSFLVFGDMDIFDPQKIHSPSGLLAKYLFNDEDNEINNVEQQYLGLLDSNEIQKITTLEKHRYELTEAFRCAKKELNIVSPFLRRNAVRLDHIEELIRRRKPDITINIYTDPTLNQKHRNEFNEVIQNLKDAGANLILVNNVHSKIITVDDLMIIAGSFNWLSASREGPYVREECSLLYRGQKTAQFIQEILGPIRKKAKIHGKVSKLEPVPIWTG